MSPFTHCHRGHDLTKPGAYIHVQGGNRVCRACHLDSLPKRKTAHHGTFDG
jgi:hypothetical protein